MGGACCRSSSAVSQPTMPRTGQVREDVSTNRITVVPHSLSHPERNPVISMLSASPIEFSLQSPGAHTKALSQSALSALHPPPSSGAAAASNRSPATRRTGAVQAWGGLNGSSSGAGKGDLMKDTSAVVDFNQTLSRTMESQRNSILTETGELDRASRDELLREVEALKASLQLFNDGVSFRSKQQFVSAAQCFERCAHIRERELGREHRDTAEAWKALGTVLLETNAALRAQTAVMAKSVTEEDEAYDSTPQTSSSGDSSGASAAASFEEAVRHLKEAVRIYRKLNEHMLAADILAQLAEVHNSRGELLKGRQMLSEAEEERRRATELQSQSELKRPTLPPLNIISPPTAKRPLLSPTKSFNPAVAEPGSPVGSSSSSDAIISGAATLEEIANLYNRLGDHSMELNFRRQAIQALNTGTSANAGEESKALGAGLVGLASAEQKLGRNDEAVHHYKEALRILEKHHDYQLVSSTMSDLSAAFGAMGNQNQELLYEQRAKEFAKSAYGATSVQVADHAFNCGACLIRLKRHKESIPYLNEALGLFEQFHAETLKKGDGDKPSLVNAVSLERTSSLTKNAKSVSSQAALTSLLHTLAKLAEAHAALGNSMQEWTLQRQAAALARKFLKNDERRVAAIQYSLGITLKNMKKSGEAIDAFKEALHLFEKVASNSPSPPAATQEAAATSKTPPPPAPAHPRASVLQTLNQLIELYAEVGDEFVLDEIEAQTTALEIEISIYGVDDIQVGSTHYNLAVTLLRHAQQRLASLAVLFPSSHHNGGGGEHGHASLLLNEDGASTLSSLLGGDSRLMEDGMANSLDNPSLDEKTLAKLREKESIILELQRALDSFQESARISSLHREHSEASESLHRAAEVFHLLGDPQQVLSTRIQALQEVREAAGSDSMELAQELMEVAAVHSEMNQHAAAITYFADAAKIQEVKGEHALAAQALNHAGTSYGILGDTANKLCYRLKALVSLKSGLGHTHPQVADQYFNLAWLHKKQQSYSEALDCYKEAHRIYLLHHGSMHPRCVSTSQQMEHCTAQLAQDKKDASCSHLVTKVTLSEDETQVLLPPIPAISPVPRSGEGRTIQVLPSVSTSEAPPTDSHVKSAYTVAPSLKLTRTRELPQCAGSILLRTIDLLRLGREYSELHIRYFEVTILSLTVSASNRTPEFSRTADEEAARIQQQAKSRQPTQQEPLLAVGFVPAKSSVSQLPGTTDAAVAFASDGMFYTSGVASDGGLDNTSGWTCGDCIGCGLDLKRGRVFFTLNGHKISSIPIDLSSGNNINAGAAAARENLFVPAVGFGSHATKKDSVVVMFGPAHRMRYQPRMEDYFNEDQHEHSLSTRAKLPLLTREASVRSNNVPSRHNAVGANSGDAHSRTLRNQLSVSVERSRSSKMQARPDDSDRRRSASNSAK